MSGLSFPPNPINGQLYPSNPLVGENQYQYNSATNTWRLLGVGNGVSAGTYGSPTEIPVIEVSATGLILDISDTLIQAASTSQSGIVQLVNDTTSNDEDKALTAAMGKYLQDQILSGVGGVTRVDTGVGLTGGPITDTGTISLIAPTGNDIGGVKAGSNINIDADGTISTPASVSEVDTGIGLSGGPITSSGIIGLIPPTGGDIGGVKAGENISIAADGTISTAATVFSIDTGVGLTGGPITESGTISLVPATSTGDPGTSSIGGVIPGRGFVYDGQSGLLDLDLTSDPDGADPDVAFSQEGAHLLEQQIQALAGAGILAGTYNAEVGELISVTASGAEKGFVVGNNLPPAAPAIDNYYVIISVGGNVGPDGPQSAKSGDWYICQTAGGGTSAWFLIEYETRLLTAQQISISPIPGLTATEVQTSLEQLESKAENAVSSVVDFSSGGLLITTSPPTPAGKTVNIQLTPPSPSGTSIGGVKAGDNITIAVDGTLSATASIFAGTIDASTGLVTAATPEGNEVGIVVNSQLPPASQDNNQYFVIVTTPGTFTPTGGSELVCKDGDWLVSDGSGWTYYAIAQTIDEAVFFQFDSLSSQFDGTLLSFDLTVGGESYSPGTSSNVLISLGGVLQIPGESFTISGAQITFDEPPETGTTFVGYGISGDTAPSGVQSGGTVTFVGTGVGLTGGPIVTSGSISLAPATSTTIGGVKPDGTTTTISPDGTISAVSGSGTVQQVDTGVGLSGGPVTTTGTISLSTATVSSIGGVKPDGSTITISPDGTISAVSGGAGTVQQVNTGAGLSGGPITTTGTLTLSPATTTEIGGVIPDGTTITVQTDGTISSVVSGGTVTQVETGVGLSGGPITTSGTIDLSPATTSALGGVKPDGTTITIQPDGTISAVGGGGSVGTLQQVTDEGATTTNTITLDGRNNSEYPLIVRSATGPKSIRIQGRTSDGQSYIDFTNPTATASYAYIRVTPTSLNLGIAPDSTIVQATSATTTISNNLQVGGYIQVDSPNGVRFYGDAGTNYIQLNAPASLTGDYSLTLPPADGTAGQVLTTDGAGNLSWTSAGGGSVGTLQQVTDAGATTDNVITVADGSGVVTTVGNTLTVRRPTINQVTVDEDSVRLYGSSGGIQAYTTLSSPTPTVNITSDAGNATFAGQLRASGLTYPTTDGTSGQVLTTDGSGNLSWATSSGSLPFANVKDYGATGDGVTDDAPAFQSAFNALGATGGMLFIPAGSYLFNSRATFTNQNISIIGAGAEVTELISNNADGIFLIDFPGLAAPPPNSMEWRCYMSNFTCWPNVTRTSTWGGSGTAITVLRVTRSLSHQTQNQTFENIVIRLSDKTPWQTTGTSPQFDNGFYLTNASQTIIHNCFIDGPGCHDSTAVYVANSTEITSGSADAYFAFRMTNTDIAGWKRGLYITGWIESVYIDNCSATSAVWNSISIDSTGTSINGIPGCYTADIHITNCHINGQANCMSFINCKDVQVENCNMYIQWFNNENTFTGNLSYVNVDIPGNEGEYYFFNNNFFNCAFTDNASTKDRFAYFNFPNSQGVGGGINISNNIFRAPIVANGQLPANNYAFFFQGDLTDIQVSNNTIKGTKSVNMTGVFCQSHTPNVSSIILSSNIYRDFYNTMHFVDTSFAQVNQGTIASVKSGGQKIINGGSSPGVLAVNNLYNYP